LIKAAALNHNTPANRQAAGPRLRAVRGIIHGTPMRSIATLLTRALQPAARTSGQPLMIVGMHRSGTSFLTGSLQAAGLELVEFSEWNPHNLKGNRENQSVVQFHERMLSDRGCSWDQPPSGRVRWSGSERAAARELIARLDIAPRWGFKDPRALLFVHGWRALLPQLRFVGIFRHPHAVAQSLHARGAMTTEQAFELWKHYNRRLIELHDATRFPLLCFDLGETLLQAKLAEALHALGLQAPGEPFWSAQLRHHAALPQPVPPGCEALYRELCARAL